MAARYDALGWLLRASAVFDVRQGRHMIRALIAAALLVPCSALAIAGRILGPRRWLGAADAWLYRRACEIDE